MATRTPSHPSFPRRGFGLALLLGLSGLTAAVGACGGTGDNENTGGSGSTQSSGTGNTGSGGSGGLFDTTSNGAGGAGGIAACATSSEEATLVPLNMIIMFDKSGSMDDANKWTNATAALKAFISDPGSAGLRVALRFFPTNDCSDPSCSLDACSQPQVNAAPLTADSAPMDAQEDALISAINAQSPNGGTPMFPALGGAEQWATNYLAANPAEKAIVILVTDGEPNGCNTNQNAIATLAGDAFTNSGVFTYAVGLAGSNTNFMNQIAAAGGTTMGIAIGNGNAEQDLLNALKAIQGSQVSCEFQMPQSQTGEPIDPAKVNVNYTNGAGVVKTLGQVSGAAACGPTGGWYYDNPDTPTTITLCGSTCSIVQADTEAKIEIVVGCATMPAD